MARRDIKLIGSLVDYVQDIKPYHTKLREFASEILFSDSCNVSLVDDHHLQVFMQNVWSRDDVGSQTLSIIAEGRDSDRYFKIPAAIWPHFSITDHLGVQSPLGDDPVVTPDMLVDSDGDGLPDYEDPWTQDRNTSHFPGSDWIPVQAVLTDYKVKLISVTKTGSTYSYTYDLQVYVDPTIEDAYGLGNNYQAYVDGVDVTYKTNRDDTVGAFDTDSYDEDPYDSVIRTFNITGLSGTFTPSQGDLDVFPNLLTQVDAWVAQFALARYRPAVEIYYTQTGRYKVPFHQGSRVYLDGNQVMFGSRYVVESGRNFIQFLAGGHPRPNQTISVNTMKTDRLFISETHPFDIDPTQNLNDFWIPFVGAGFDETPYEDLPYDMGLPNRVCDYFSFKIDDIYPGRVSPVSFMNSTTTAGKATLTVTKVHPSAINGEIYLVQATGPWTFSVQQVLPYRGPIQYGSFKQPFSNGKIELIVDKTWTPYYMVPDPNSYASYAQVYDVYAFDPVDPTDHLLNLSLETQHGVVTDPTADGTHGPVEFVSIGKVMKVVDVNAMSKAWIGVEVFDVPGTATGATVSTVYPGSVAESARIMVGDVIISINGQPISQTVDFLSFMDSIPPFTEMDVTFVRGIQSYTVGVVSDNQFSDMEYYQFVLNNVPQRGTYYEIRVEQTDGLNPRVHTTIDESVVITVLEDSNTLMFNKVYDSRNPNNATITDTSTDPINTGDPVTYVQPGYVDPGYVA